MNTFCTHPWSTREDGTGEYIHINDKAVWVPQPSDEGKQIIIGEPLEARNITHRSLNSSTKVNVCFQNDTGNTVELFWHNFEGGLVSYGKIQANGRMGMNTFCTHPWSAKIEGDANTKVEIDREPVYVPMEIDSGNTMRITRA